MSVNYIDSFKVVGGLPQEADMICIHCDSPIEDWAPGECPSCGHKFTDEEVERMHDNFVDYYYGDD